MPGNLHDGLDVSVCAVHIYVPRMYGGVLMPPNRCRAASCPAGNAGRHLTTRIVGRGFGPAKAETETFPYGHGPRSHAGAAGHASPGGISHSAESGRRRTPWR